MTQIAKHRGPRLRWARTTALVALTATTLMGGMMPLPLLAKERSSPVRQFNWQGNLYLARLIRSNQLVMQLAIADKPATSYANAVYTVYARRQNQWLQVYTSTGARLVTNAAGQTMVTSEVINLQEIQAQLGRDVDWSQVEMKAVATLRYDVRGVARDQQVQFEQVQRYSAIATTETTQIASQATWATSSSEGNWQDVRSARKEKTGFSLAILQNQSSLSHVIARISMRERQGQGFLPERFVGDFRYKLKGKKNKAKFIKGLKAGDRVVVRLFDKQDRFIGYSEFEMQAVHTVVSLILSSESANSGVVRTVYGTDTDQDFNLDRTGQIFDYFTQVTQVGNYLDSRVSFFSTSQAFNSQLFTVAGLPQPRSNCSYPASLQAGNLMVVNREFWAFNDSLATALISRPGEVVQIMDLSSTSITTYEVSQLVIQSQTVGISQGTLITTSEDYGEYRPGKKPKKRHCNQGIGNGSEGCDPGNSRPHGGSNDEDDHRSGRHRDR